MFGDTPEARAAIKEVLGHLAGDDGKSSSSGSFEDDQHAAGAAVAAASDADLAHSFDR